jgi:hypothetical protein
MYIVCWKLANVSEKHVASILMVEHEAGRLTSNELTAL